MVEDDHNDISRGLGSPSHNSCTPCTTPDTGKQWIGRSLPSAPSFRYYNVAIASPDSAAEATTAYHAKTTTNAEVDGTCVVRELSSAEIAALSLTVGEVRRA
jgi:hypothetical protein